MEDFIWLDQPIHKNRIKFELENEDSFNFSFDGSIISFSPKIIDENKDMFKDIQNSKLGYKKLDIPKSIKSEKDLIFFLFYFAE